MGDRANIYLELPTDYTLDRPKGGIYLYTHSRGYVWPERLREALAFGAGRWTDDQYIARIITSRVFADLIDSETGGGIGLMIGDNQYPVTVVEVDGQTVSFAEEGDEQHPGKRYGRMSFAEYVAQDRADYPTSHATH